MAAESSVSTRRRTTTRPSKDSVKPNSNPSNSNNLSNSSPAEKAFQEPEPSLPSRIPIKSPSRSAIGGLAMAYSPIRQSSPSFTTEKRKEEQHQESSYSKRMAELRNAMDLLKTPPAPQPQSHSNLVASYTPLKSSSLSQVQQSTSPFASALDTIEISMETSSSASETEGSNLTMEIDISTDPTSILDRNIDNSSAASHRVYDSSFLTSPRINGHHPQSSPYPSSEELKKRLEATREAFQRSLEAQKLRLRTSLNFSELDSSFSTCSAAESDISIDSLRDAREQLARIKKEVSEIIDSDLEELEVLKKKQSTNNSDENLIRAVKSESVLTTIFKFTPVFAILAIIFTYFFISVAPTWNQILTVTFNKKAALEKMEEFINFLLQDN